MIKKHVFLLLAVCLNSPVSFSDIHYTNISHNQTAEALFNKGMLNYYAYLYVQAEYDFRQSIIYDPKCGLCFWGLAVAKKQEALELHQPFATVGFDDIRKASQLISSKDTFQYDLVRATIDSFSLNANVSDKQLHIQYINALRQLYQKYKNNREWREESLALFVDAIAYYGNVNDGVVGNHSGHMSNNDYQQEALDLLIPVLKDTSYPDHPGLLHTYIHMAKPQLQDPLGLIVAKKLPHFSHGVIAHYTHMPTHIYWRLGMYDEAIQANLAAIAIDQNYFKHSGAGLNSYYYEYHYLHAHHFLTALGILTNNYDLAIHYARLIKSLMDVNRMKSLMDDRDIFFSLEHLVLARFNKWQDILNLEIPLQVNELARLFIDFSRSLAYLNLGQIKQFNHLYTQIHNTKYVRKNMIELQILVVSYLKASERNAQQAPISELESIFLNNHVNEIEEKLFTMNPPLWFFSYQLFLSHAAAARSDLQAANKYYLLYERMYPKSTLGRVTPKN